MNVPFVDLKAQYQSIKSEIDPAIQSVISETAFVGGKYVEGFEKAYRREVRRQALRQLRQRDGRHLHHPQGPGHRPRRRGHHRRQQLHRHLRDHQPGRRQARLRGHRRVLPHRSGPDRGEDHRRRPRPSSPSTSSASRWIIEAVKAICDKHKLHLIEDCAQSHFATLQGPEDRDVRHRRDLQLLSRQEPRRLRGRRGDRHGRRRIRPERPPVRQPRLPPEVHPRDRGHQQPPRRHPGRRAQGQARAHRRLEQGPEQPRPEVQRAPGRRRRRSRCPKLRPDTFHIFHLYVIRAERRDDLAAFLKTKGVVTGIHYPDGPAPDAGLSLSQAQALGLPGRLRVPGPDPVAAHVSGARGRADRLCRGSIKEFYEELL